MNPNLSIENKTKENLSEGSRIKLYRRESYLDKGRWKKGRIHAEHITNGRESPKQAFEMLFPRYQIARYRNIDLGLQNSAFENFFKFHRWSGLEISGLKNPEDTIESRDNKYMKPALRNPNKRNPEILGKEAIYILNEIILPWKKTYKSGGLDFENLSLVANELADAFENLRNQGIISG
ncbi:MAG: hypothetical protein ACOCUU_03430 [Nanoarchaeota archaeon]